VTIDFPDCPGCATFAEANEEPIGVAREALEGWLEAHLDTDQSPPRPGAISFTPGTQILSVAVSSALSKRLRQHWARIDG